SKSKAAIAASPKWRSRWAGARPTTCSIRIGVCTASIAANRACRSRTCSSTRSIDRTSPDGHRRMIAAPCPALVLTAGLGTRLRPLTTARAKPAIPVAGEPMIRRIIAWLVRHGVRDLVLNLHHLPASLTAIVGDGSDLAARVRYSWEQPIVLGSAGGPRLA